MARRLNPSDLLKAACSGDVEEVMKLLHVSDQSQSVDGPNTGIDVTDKGGKTALHLAVTRNRRIQRARTQRAISTLVCAGADINSQSYSDNKLTPLMLAVLVGNLSSVRTLLELGADVKCVSRYGTNALMLAALSGHYDCLECLINVGAGVNVQIQRSHSCNMHFGQTALMFAAQSARIKCLKLLLKRGADVNVKASHGETALHMAATCYPVSKKVIKCMKILIDSGADCNATNVEGETPLMLVVRRLCHCETKKLLKDKLVKFLLTFGTDVNKGNREGQTLMMLATGSDRLLYLMSILLQAGADLDQQDSCGMTALFHAIKNKNTKCISWLIESGADVSKIDSKGRTVLIYAVINHVDIKVLPILIKAGAVINFNQQDAKGMTALTHAVRNGHVFESVRSLVHSGASINIKDHSGKTPLHHFLSECSLSGKTQLHSLITRCHGADIYREYLNLLVIGSQYVYAKDKDGMTPLMYASQFCADEFYKKKVLEILFANKEKTLAVNDMDNRGQTAFGHFLMADRHLFSGYRSNHYHFNQSIKRLLDSGAKPSVGRLAEGKMCNVTFLDFDLNLMGLEVGNEVDLKVPMDRFLAVISKGFRRILLFLISNQVMPQESLFLTMYQTTSMLEQAVKEGNLGVTKYLIATCYMRSTDLTFALASSLGHPIEPNTPDVVTVIANLRNQPWPLVKLCFVVVSTTFGASPGRQERVKNSQLPPKLQRMLLFQENTSRLCVHQWDKIPLTFSPEEYEKLSSPHPLLYHWPVGRALVPCDCGECDGTMYKYESEEEDNESDED